VRGSGGAGSGVEFICGSFIAAVMEVTNKAMREHPW
jgi:hypothetical protein